MKEKIELYKSQELVYELTIHEVMTKKVITVGPDTMMSELRLILRENRISGTPVVKDGNVIGIISVEDFIKWLSEGKVNCSVKEKMEKNVKILYEDEPLVYAIDKLEKLCFGRFPILNRKTKKLVGVITKGNIIAGLLKKLEIEYHEEEVRHYRASHLFEDIISDDTTLTFHYAMKQSDSSKLLSESDMMRGGEIAGKIKKNLKRLGIHPSVVRRAAIATYEAEMNAIIYAQGGEITVSINIENINIEVKDRGDGIPDIKKALTPGYSTAPGWVRELGFGAGMGLHNIKNIVDVFDIKSKVGKGTLLNFSILMEKECA